VGDVRVVPASLLTALAMACRGPSRRHRQPQFRTVVAPDPSTSMPGPRSRASRSRPRPTASTRPNSSSHSTRRAVRSRRGSTGTSTWSSRLPGISGPSSPCSTTRSGGRAGTTAVPAGECWDTSPGASGIRPSRSTTGRSRRPTTRGATCGGGPVGRHRHGASLVRAVDLRSDGLEPSQGRGGRVAVVVCRRRPR